MGASYRPLTCGRHARVTRPPSSNRQAPPDAGERSRSSAWSTTCYVLSWTLNEGPCCVGRCPAENRTRMGLPPPDFEYAYGDDRAIAGLYGHFRGAVLPG